MKDEKVIFITKFDKYIETVVSDREVKLIDVSASANHQDSAANVMIDGECVGQYKRFPKQEVFSRKFEPAKGYKAVDFKTTDICYSCKNAVLTTNYGNDRVWVWCNHMKKDIDYMQIMTSCTAYEKKQGL